MNEIDIKRDILKIVSEVIDIKIEEIDINAKRQNYIKWDSLATLIIFMRLEEKYGIKFSEEDIKIIDSVKKIYEKIINNNIANK